MKHTVAGVMIKNRGRYLLVQEKLEKCYGQWNWPAGHVDSGETVEHAAIREAKEEVGLDVVLGRKLGEWHDEEAGRTRILFLAESYSGDMQIQLSEILGAAWLDKSQIEALRDSIRSKDWIADFVGKESI
jgi:8-oxo-dGTP diphosphatase